MMKRDTIFPSKAALLLVLLAAPILGAAPRMGAAEGAAEEAAGRAAEGAAPGDSSAAKGSGGEPARREKIGLVLGGGGARGYAHVGTLEVLEELRIPVDFIAGSSAGSIIAGLYAAGMSPAEIKETILSMDWDDLFNDNVERSERPFRRKQDDRSDFFNIELGFKGLRPVMGGGLVAGQKLPFAFKYPYLLTPDYQDFDDLNIPYRAVATDIESGGMVVISSGSLYHSIRASISIPAIFAPVHHQGKYLVDGGLLRLVPVDVVEEMGADVLIVVDVGVPVDELDASKLRTIADISMQTNNIIQWNTSRELMASADVLIRHRLPGVEVLDFKKAAEIMEKGEKVAREHAGELSRYSVGEEEYARYLGRQRHGDQPPPRISEVRVENNSGVPESVIRRRISIEPGDLLDMDRLETDIGRLYELGVFESVDFMISGEPGRNALVIRAREKYYSPNLLHVGFDYIDDLEGRSDFGILARYSRLEMNALGGELKGDLRVGLSRGAALEYYQPLEPSRSFFITAGAMAGSDTRDIYDGESRIAEYELRYAGFRAGAGLQLGRFAELRAGVDRLNMNTVVGAGQADLPEEWKVRSTVTAEFSYDLLDNTDLPSRGGSGKVRFAAARRILGGEDDYRKLSIDAAQFVSIGRTGLFASVSGGHNLDTDIPFDDMFTLGGPGSFSGLKPEQLRGRIYGAARLGFYRKIIEGKVIVGPTVYAGGWFEAGNIWETRAEASIDDLICGGSFIIGVNTVLGPAMIGYGRTDAGYGSFFLTMGRQFGSFPGVLTP